MRLKIINLGAVALLMTLAHGLTASQATAPQTLSNSFEFRYFDTDPAANGETDFKGPTAVFDTDQRIEFLRQYAEFAKEFFNDPDLDKQVVTDAEVHNLLSNLKPQPLPKVRKKIPLKKCKCAGYKEGLTQQRRRELSKWRNIEGVCIKDAALILVNQKVRLQQAFALQSWRFSVQFKARPPATTERQTFSLSENDTVVVTVGFNDSGRIFYRSGKSEFQLHPCTADAWSEFKIEVDLAHDTGRYNFYLDGELKADHVKLNNSTNHGINTFSVEGTKNLTLDDILITGHAPTGDVKMPYTITTLLDESFEPPPRIEGWNRLEYDDTAWQTAQLPKVHGGERFAGEGLYLRKTIGLGDFTRAALNIETLDPSGQIWVNGRSVATLKNRHPARIDITEYLKPNDTNLVAVKIDHFHVRTPMHHTPSDFNIGWFVGRMSLDLTAQTYIDDVFLYAKNVSNPAHVNARIRIENKTAKPFDGTVTVGLYDWLPNESSVPAATAEFPAKIPAAGYRLLENTISVPEPRLWSCENPNLYKIEVTLKNASAEPIDDYAFTTGLRTISQRGGAFRINTRHEMLNGAQIMGFRLPIDKIAAWNRCPPIEWLAKELLMIKKMNGNMMRVHVHAWQDPARGVNDPRLAEIGDQLGIMFIWTTTAWIRTGTPWGVDFDGYPRYMKQVYNHPSIVMWEAANHPNTFKKHDLAESNRFCEKVYDTIYPVDPSRLISLTSHIRHLHFGSDLGTINQQKNPITPAPAWTAPMVTRGNQDSITGYGKDWSVLRKWPDHYTKDFLESPHRAYFNFEHEESIAQPNWDLAKGKPWYHLQSYEWPYDKGSIGRLLTVRQWCESQAWQAFSAYESMKKQRILDYDGFSWCCLHGGPNTATYKKPLIDSLGHAKLAFYTNKMAFQKVLAGSSGVDVVYGPEDELSPIIMNLGPTRTVDLRILIKNTDNVAIETKSYPSINLAEGRTITRLPPFKPLFPSKAHYVIQYKILSR